MASNLKEKAPSKRMEQLYGFDDENNPEIIFEEDRKKKSLAARKPVPTKKVGLKTYTDKQVEKASSEVVTIDLKKVYDYDIFKKFSKELQVIYLDNLFEKYHLNLHDLGKLFKRNLTTVSRFIVTIGVDTYAKRVSLSQLAKERELNKQLRAKFYKDYALEEEETEMTPTETQTLQKACEQVNEELNSYKTKAAKLGLHLETTNPNDVIKMFESIKFIEGTYTIDIKVE